MKQNRLLIAILAFTFVLNAGFAFFHHIRPAVDASAYDQMGWNIARGEGFRLVLGVPIEQDEAITYQGPLYQFFLAGIYSVFGHATWAVWIVQALLRTASVWLVYAIGVRAFGEKEKRVGLLAALFFGVYPDLVELGAMLMTETLFIFLTLLVVYLFLRQFDRPTLRWSALLGLAFGLGILSRSSILLYGLVFAFWYLRRRALLPFLTFCFVGGLMLVPWTVRNAYVYHQFIPTMANAGYNLWVGNREGATGEGGNPPSLPAYQAEYGMTGANRFFTGRFRAFVSEHPFSYASLSAGRFVKYFSIIRPLGFWFYQTGWPQLAQVASSAVASFFLFGFGFAGVWMVWRDKREAARYLTAFAALTALPIIMVIISTRYRVPVYPFFVMLGAYALFRLWEKPRQEWKVLIGAYAAVFLLAGIDGAQSVPKVIGHIRDLKP